MHDEMTALVQQAWDRNPNGNLLAKTRPADSSTLPRYNGLDAQNQSNDSHIFRNYTEEEDKHEVL
jgi:hypothetical protein